jgi:hypothetical protein
MIRIAGGGMGFVVKSAFWLGLVYSAMPFDSGSPIAVAPTATAPLRAAGSPLGTLAGAVIPPPLQNKNAWKSGMEVAAGLCATNCLRAIPAGLADRCSSANRTGGAAAPARLREIQATLRCFTADG